MIRRQRGCILQKKRRGERHWLLERVKGFESSDLLTISRNNYAYALCNLTLFFILGGEDYQYFASYKRFLCIPIDQISIHRTEKEQTVAMATTSQVLPPSLLSLLFCVLTYIFETGFHSCSGISIYLRF